MNASDAIIGGLIALSGVVLTLFSTHVSEWIKSSRDRVQSERERGLSLKRDIYLPLVQAFTEGINLFVAIPQAHHSRLSELKMSKEAQNALAAKDLIACDSVMSAVNNASKQLAQGTMRLMALKMDEALLSVDLEHLNTNINNLNAENRLIIDRMRALQDAGALQPNVALQLDAQFQHNDTELQHLFAQQEEKFTEKNEILRKLHMQIMKEVGELTAVTAMAVIEIRRDLEIPTDETSIFAHYRESIEFAESVFPEFMENVWKKVAEKTTSERSLGEENSG